MAFDNAPDAFSEEHTNSPDGRVTANCGKASYVASDPGCHLGHGLFSEAFKELGWETASTQPAMKGLFDRHLIRQALRRFQ
jgi:hypothetical protein